MGSKKLELPFKKGLHVNVVRTIAEGLNAINELNTYLELGVQRGQCFNSVAPLVRKTAYAVDISDQTFGFIKSNKNLKWFNGKTDDFFAQLEKITFDMVFIDADHNHTSSMKDFDNVFPLVRDNGLILLHDTYPPSKEFIEPSYCGDTYKTAECIKQNYKDKCEIVTLPFYFGVSVVRKCVKQLNYRM
jgi:hypothetical protein